MNNWKQILNKVRNKASILLYPPVHHLHFTDHSVSHSDRIIEITKGILEAQPYSGLNEEERYILYAAAYLHDIGMQIPKSKLLRYPDLDELLSKFELSREDIKRDERCLIDFIRKWHHLFSEYMIIDCDLDLGLNDLHEGIILQIAKIAKGHRKVDLYDNEFSESGDVRIRLLAALLRLSDAIDCDHRRIDLARLNIFDNLSIESKSHWFLHYCIQKVVIKDLFLEINALIPPGFSDIFRTTFILPLWQEYRNVLDILKENRIILVWGRSNVEENEIMDRIFRRFDSPKEELKEYMTNKTTEIWNDIRNILGDEEEIGDKRSELEVSPYYFTGVEKFKGIQLNPYPEGVYAASYSIFSSIETSGEPIWTSPVIKKDTQERVSLPPPDLELEKGKKYSFRIDFYWKEDMIFLSQRGIFWIIEKELTKKKEKGLEKLSIEERDLYIAFMAEGIGAYEEAIRAYLRLVDTISEEKKIEIIQRLVMILERISKELKNLGWINERDQVLKRMAYWAR
ncbi:MAG: HD domain-containing protein [Nitrospirota bacterium]